MNFSKFNETSNEPKNRDNPMRPINYGTGRYGCPVCHTEVSFSANYCSHCGQRIDKNPDWYKIPDTYDDDDEFV